MPPETPKETSTMKTTAKTTTIQLLGEQVNVSIITDGNYADIITKTDYRITLDGIHTEDGYRRINRQYVRHQSVMGYSEYVNYAKSIRLVHHMGGLTELVDTHIEAAYRTITYGELRDMAYAAYAKGTDNLSAGDYDTLAAYAIASGWYAIADHDTATTCTDHAAAEAIRVMGATCNAIAQALAKPEAEATEPEAIETTITQEQAEELHTLRLEKALSWYELAQRYGITDDEARRVYGAIHSGKAVTTIEASTETLAEAVHELAAKRDALDAAEHDVFYTKYTMGVTPEQVAKAVERRDAIAAQYEDAKRRVDALSSALDTKATEDEAAQTLTITTERQHIASIDAHVYIDSDGSYVYQDMCGYRTYRTLQGLNRYVQSAAKTVNRKAPEIVEATKATKVAADAAKQPTKSVKAEATTEATTYTTDQLAEALEAAGLKRWTKRDMDRMYANPSVYGVSFDYYKSGNISSCTITIDGDEVRVSNAEGGRFKSTKAYVDLADASVHVRTATDYEDHIAATLEAIVADAIATITTTTTEATDESADQPTEAIEVETIDGTVRVTGIDAIEAIGGTISDCYATLCGGMAEHGIARVTWLRGDEVVAETRADREPSDGTDDAETIISDEATETDEATTGYLTADEISALEAAGFRRWQKFGHDRLYFDDCLNGGIYAIYSDAEAKAWVDVTDGELHARTYPRSIEGHVLDTVGRIYHDTLNATRAKANDEDETTEADERADASLTDEQARELHHLRFDMLWSWWELANRYGIDEREARRVYNRIHAEKVAEANDIATTEDEATTADEATTETVSASTIGSDEDANDVDYEAEFRAKHQHTTCATVWVPLYGVAPAMTAAALVPGIVCVCTGGVTETVIDKQASKSGKTVTLTVRGEHGTVGTRRRNAKTMVGVRGYRIGGTSLWDIDWPTTDEDEATTTTVDADGEVADEGTTVDERGEIVESDVNETTTTKAKKSYARNGYGQVCAFDSRQERDTFVRLVNERVSGDRLMAACTAREAYSVRDKVDEDGEVGTRYFDMSITEYFDGDWAVLDQMTETDATTTTDHVNYSYLNSTPWQVACYCCDSATGSGCNTDRFAFNFWMRTDVDAALLENVRDAREMVADCIDHAAEYLITGEEVEALADELHMIDEWLDDRDGDARRLDLARDVIAFTNDVDPYQLASDMHDGMESAAADLAADLTQCVAWLEDQIFEYDDEEARELLARVRAALDADELRMLDVWLDENEGTRFVGTIERDGYTYPVTCDEDGYHVDLGGATGISDSLAFDGDAEALEGIANIIDREAEDMATETDENTYRYFAYVSRMALVEYDERYIERNEDENTGRYYSEDWFETEEDAIAFVKAEMADYVDRELGGKGYKVIRTRRGLDTIEYCDGTVERHYVDADGEVIDYGDDPSTEHYYRDGFYESSLPDGVRNKAERIMRGYHDYLDYEADHYDSLADELAE